MIGIQPHSIDSELVESIDLFSLQRLILTCSQIEQLAPNNKFCNSQKIKDMINQELETQLQSLLDPKSIINVYRVINLFESLKYLHSRLIKQSGPTDGMSIFSEFDIDAARLFN